MKKIFSILGLFLLPVGASAHVKWFVDSKEVVSDLHNQTVFYSWGSTEVIVWAVIVCAIVLLFGFIDRKINAPKGLVSYGLKYEKGIRRIAQGILGFFLVSVSVLWKVVIVPEVPAIDTLTSVLLVVQAIIGLMFIINMRVRIASSVLILLCIGLFVREGAMAFLENAMLCALAVYFFIEHSPADSKVYRLHKHAVEIVRVGTGISLITLAFTEKLLYPELSLQFLQVHQWNFMAPLLPWFTDKLFVLSTGFAEIIFGILFVMGYLTRTTTILIAIFFALSVVTMAVGFNMWEVEDLVVYSAATLFIFYGHGRTKFFHFT